MGVAAAWAAQAAALGPEGEAQPWAFGLGGLDEAREAEEEGVFWSLGRGEGVQLTG